MFKKIQSVDSIVANLKFLITELNTCQTDKEVEAAEHQEKIEEAEKARAKALAEAKRASEVKFRIQELIGE